MVAADDSSAGSKRAGELAAGIGNICGAEVLLVRAYPVVLPVGEASKRSRAPGTSPGDARVDHEVELGMRARRLEGDLGIRPRVRAVSGEAAQAILEAAEKGGVPTLVAVGRHGIGRLDRLRLGSVSTKVMRAARGPVLIVPP